MTNASNLYVDGVITGKIENSADILFKKIQEMKDAPREGYFWETKYPGTKDFRPDVFSYDSCFLDVLFKNNVDKFIQDATKSSLCLAHIQLRMVFPGNSYMNWHRDTHFKDNAVVSCSPPAYKIIMFPNDDSDICNYMLKGSHICHLMGQSSSDYLSPGFSKFDKQILDSGMFQKETFRSSTDNFVLFNTSILHAAAESNRKDGSVRLIYVFVDKEQFESKYSHKKEHSELNKEFQRRIKSKK
tara:strand:+ start:216 stop:944 length:729 start_codon:yes stop_codon:yes gene_type:complete